MANSRRMYDVFLSATPSDSAVADVVRRSLEEAGLSVFSFADVEVHRRWNDAVRQAILESVAFVAVVTPAAIKSSAMTMSFGAAMVWKKPIYLLLQGVRAADVPEYMIKFPTKSVADLPLVVDEILKAAGPMPVRHREVLGEVYRRMGISTDRLATNPQQLDRLTTEFNRTLSAKLGPEQVLTQLFQLRKSGKLPKLRRKVKQVSNSTGS